ncbi:MAG: tetratricopeptide repeat protein [Gallionella sp.]|nr:tetratricopeptide repeat protein [Gallionella sp.]
MNLLMNARRKQHNAALELILEEQPIPAAENISPLKNIRDAGQNLFSAKSPAASAWHTRRRNWLVACCGTTLLLAAGYYRYGGSANKAQPSNPVASIPAQLIPYAAAAEPEIRNIFAAPAADKPPLLAIAESVKSTALAAIASPENVRIRIERQKTVPVNPLLNNAYQAYLSGDLDMAQRLYRELLGGDARNTDAWLGIAVIAQQRGEDNLAAQYYSRVLALDPRNAVAHTGMSALTANDGDEQHLQSQLDGQQGSAVLHFALGNRYAEQARWDEAQQSYFTAYTLKSGNAEFAFNLAVSLDHLGQSSLAAQYYQRALQLDDQPHRFDHAQTEQRIRELTR